MPLPALRSPAYHRRARGALQGAVIAAMLAGTAATARSQASVPPPDLTDVSAELVRQCAASGTCARSWGEAMRAWCLSAATREEQVRCIRAQNALWQQKQRLIMKAVGRGVVLVNPTSADGPPEPALTPPGADLQDLQRAEPQDVLACANDYRCYHQWSSSVTEACSAEPIVATQVTCQKARRALWEQKIVEGRRTEDHRPPEVHREAARQAGLRAAAAAELANAQPHPAIALARRAHPPTNMVFLGIALGAPMRTMPACDMFAADATSTCRVELSLDENADPLMAMAANPFLMMVASGAISAPPDASILLRVERQPWLRMAYLRGNHGVMTGLSIATEGGDGPLRYLRKRYGKETRKHGEQWEWTLPGLRIRYSRPAVGKMPEIPYGTPVRHTCVDSANCTRADELQADLSSEIMTGLGNAMIGIPISKAATTPNLILEVAAGDDVTAPSAPAAPARK
jgi:hypothetical protein